MPSSFEFNARFFYQNSQPGPSYVSGGREGSPTYLDTVGTYLLIGDRGRF